MAAKSHSVPDGEGEKMRLEKWGGLCRYRKGLVPEHDVFLSFRKYLLGRVL